MTLEGWDHVPRGYGAQFDLDGAPWWLRLWFRTPFLDRWAHPKAVARGHGYLVPHEHDDDVAREVPGPGWLLRPPGHVGPGSQDGLRSTD